MDSTSTISTENAQWRHHIIPTHRTYFGQQPQYLPTSQKGRLLSLLSSRSYIPLPEIQNLRIADYSRVMSYMKDDGYIIECYCDNEGGHRHSVYVLRGFDERKKKKHLSWYAIIWHSITGK